MTEVLENTKKDKLKLLKELESLKSQKKN